jgi:hypothetical protein
MHQITLNDFPKANRCNGCKFSCEVPQELNQIFKNSLICLNNNDAETCILPEISLAIPNITKIIPTMNFRSALRARRQNAASPNCKNCNGLGEIINLKTKEQLPCSCTR